LNKTGAILQRTAFVLLEYIQHIKNFYYFCARLLISKNTSMNTLVLNVSNASVVDQLMSALSLFKGVKNVTLLNAEQVENASLLAACKEARQTPVVSKEEIFKVLA
jgi:hypothetical protein